MLLYSRSWKTRGRIELIRASRDLMKAAVRRRLKPDKLAFSSLLVFFCPLASV